MDLTAEADALRRERDDLAARLAKVEAQKPVAFFRLSDAKWLAIGRPAIVYKTADGDWREPLYSYPAQAAAPERAEPKPCRCGPDDCPKGGAA
jgi:hypothetical protein